MASPISVTLVWCYESQCRQLKNVGGKNFFHTSHGQNATIHFYALPESSSRATTKLLPTGMHTMSTPPSTFLDPPLTHGLLHEAILLIMLTCTRHTLCMHIPNT